MANVSTTRQLYNQQSFVPGARLVDGGDFARLFNASQSVVSGLVAHAGGGQAAATTLTAAINQVDTVASANDSVALPVAIPGTIVRVINNTATSMQVFGQASNPNTGAGDTITAAGSSIPIATGTGQACGAGVAFTYVCAKAGNWKQMA